MSSCLVMCECLSSVLSFDTNAPLPALTSPRRPPQDRIWDAAALEERAQPRAYALKVIREMHEAWVKSHGQIQAEKAGRRGTSFGVMSSPSMSELELSKPGAAAANGNGVHASTAVA